MLSQTGLGLDPFFEQHKTPDEYPECDLRVRRIQEKLEADGLTTECRPIALREASVEELALMHSPDYINYLASAYANGETCLNVDEVEISENSFSVAKTAAGTCLNAVDLIASGSIRNAFLAVRPPGHHAEYAVPMGFCLFNNVAIAARYAQEKHNFQRVYILDWDVHHGNGTQHLFEKDDSVFYCSLHTHPAVFYPGTGYSEEIGVGNGTGYTLNIPLEPKTPEAEYLQTFEKRVISSIDRFQPDLIIISAGFDAHREDPLGNQLLNTRSFKLLTSLVTDAAHSICSGKVLSVLEGGYNLDALARSAATHLEQLVHAS